MTSINSKDKLLIQSLAILKTVDSIMTNLPTWVYDMNLDIDVQTTIKEIKEELKIND